MYEYLNSLRMKLNKIMKSRQQYLRIEYTHHIYEIVIQDYNMLT